MERYTATCDLCSAAINGKKCETNSAEIAAKSALGEHWRNIHDRDINSRSCDICGAVVSTKMNVGLHFLRIHKIPLSIIEPRRKKMFCDGCGFKFCDGTDLARHLAVCAYTYVGRLPKKIKTWTAAKRQCDDCQFIAKCGDFMRHWRQFHWGIKSAMNYTCDQCDYRSRFKTDLGNHSRRKKHKLS